MRASDNIVVGTFFGADIEPGVFHASHRSGPNLADEPAQPGKPIPTKPGPREPEPT